MTSDPLRILILEDVPMDAELVTYELERASLPFMAKCVDTQEDFARELDEFRPDVILSDYTLPRFDGMAALALAKTRAPATPLLIVTGSVNEETAVRCMKAGAADYLLKGNLSRIGPAIEAAIARARARAEQARAQQALRRSEANLRALFNNSLQAFVLVGPDGRIQAINRTAQEWAQRILGRLPGEGESISQFIPGTADRFRAALGGETTTLELCIEDTAGVPCWFETTSTPVIADDGAVVGVCLSAVNIDERRRAAEAVAVSERRFRSLVQNSSDRVLVLAGDGRVLYASDSAVRIVGREPAELVGTSLLAAADPASAAAVRALLDGAGREPGAPPLELSLAHSDGHEVWLEAVATDLRGDPLIGGVVVNARDVSERKRAEWALRESEQRYRTLFDSAGDLVCMMGADGAFLYANRAWQRALGYGEGELSSLRLRDLVHAEHRAAFDAAFGRVLAGERLTHLETLFVTRDGAALTVEGSANCSVDEGGRVVRAIFRDVTERKRVEEQFRRAERMQAAGRLAGGVAHEVNNMMTGVIGFSSILLRSLEQGDPRRADIEQILRAGSRAADITRQLLAFTRQQFQQVEIFDVNEAILKSDRMLRRSAGDDHELVIRLAPGGCFVRADGGQLEQVLVNLVLNARDAIAGAGRISIETASVVLDRAYAQRHAVVSVPPGPYVMIAVSDTGCGMTREVQARIFEPFFTTKPVGHGTGLGLSTVYGIVKQSGGFVWAYSEPGEGTVFKVYLPLVAETAPAREDHDASAPRPSGAETILVVEDEDVVRVLTGRALAEQGYRVVESRNANEALRYLRDHAGDVDLVLCDVVMPGMSGRELGTRLATLAPELPILFMSGYTGEDVVQRGLLDPHAAFEQKPFTPERLTQRVRDLLDRPAPPPPAPATSRRRPGGRRSRGA
jgi:PAS domain S-box-containing protein